MLQDVSEQSCTVMNMQILYGLVPLLQKFQPRLRNGSRVGKCHTAHCKQFAQLFFEWFRASVQMDPADLADPLTFPLVPLSAYEPQLYLFSAS